MIKKYITIYVTIGAFFITSTNFNLFQAQAQTARVIDEIVVTSRKRTESSQDVPLPLVALREESLEELGINVFEDYLLQLPSVTAGGSGPGQSTVYIRGLASTTPNLTTAGVAGLSPNVSFYLDEQPLAQPGRNLDVYAADMERIEVLSGPQGTLFGASSQAGVVRMISNKPTPGVYEGSLEVESRYMPEGDMGGKLEAVINVPINDTTTWRLVAYRDRRGGYIDNVAGMLDASQSARFRSEGTIRSNGIPVSSSRAGFQAGSDLSNVNFVKAKARVEEDANETTYTGYRTSILKDFDDNWSALLSYSNQTIESDGVFFADPNLDDLEVQRYSDDSIKDEFNNISLTIEGKIGDLEVLYAGAYTDRETSQNVDYTDYLFVGQYLPYYICDGSVTYPGSAGPTGTCQAPDLFVDSHTDTKIQTHELRFNTPSENFLSATFGAFYSKLELKELNDFVYPGSSDAISFNGSKGFGPNYPLTNTSVTGNIGNASPGYFQDAGPFSDPIVFRNDILRTDDQLGIFGELNFDLVPDKIELTLGARWYDIEVDLEGSANSSFYNFGASTDAQVFGTNISDKYSANNPYGNPDKASTDGTILKGTLKWSPEDGKMYYVTYSEGFRPGLLNRPGGASGPDGYSVPYAVQSDEVANYEFGWKVLSNNGALRLNGSMFFVKIDGLQTTIFDTSIVNLFFSDNAANAEIKGLEADFLYLSSIEGLSFAGAISMLDTEITKKITPTNDVIVGSDLAFAPSFQGNLRLRYEWSLDSGNRAHIMSQVTFSEDSFSDIIQINNDKINSWETLDLRLGITTESWLGELYVLNLTDERAEISRSYVFDKERVTYMRPMTIGLRFKKDF